MQTRLAALYAAAALTLCGAGAVSAQSLSFGGVTDYDTGGAGVVIELHGAPIIERDGWTGSWGVAARLDADQDAWVGVGFAANIPLSDAFFVEASFMPGYYSEGETELGGNLHFRSLLGLGMNVGDGAFILSIDHLSNGNLHETNPGSEAIALRYQLQF